jgi:hypothetical protein
MVPAIVLMALPKCPLCFGILSGIFGALGIAPWIRGAWGVPLGAAVLAVTVSALSVRAFRNHNPRPLLPGIVGAAALVAGRQVSDFLLLLVGACLLLAAFVLQSVSGPKPHEKEGN